MTSDDGRFDWDPAAAPPVPFAQLQAGVRYRIVIADG
jgi:hypothetical protein